MTDGNIVYQGEAKNSTLYFAKIGYQCGRFQNPADFFMNILAINSPDDIEKKIMRFKDSYDKELRP